MSVVLVNIEHSNRGKAYTMDEWASLCYSFKWCVGKYLSDAVIVEYTLRYTV